MADITNGITVSFMNTPQAVDDYYASSATKLTEDTLASVGVLTLDVMSNDLGGKAKTLYSIDDANLSDDQSTYAYDLLQKDALTNGASVPEKSTFGAKIWIDNGKIKYDASAISGPELAAINQLGAGESLNDTFTYAIRMSNGAISWATVSVQIAGTNDLPTISVADDKGEVVEDATSPTLKDSGAITFDDVDLTDTHSTSVANDPGNALGGTLTAIIADTATGVGDGKVTWSYEVHNSATQYLAKGETVDEKFTIKISDNHGGFVEQLVTVTVTGTNDGPTISAADDKGAVTEDDGDPLSTTGSITFDDVDLIDVHTTKVTTDAGNNLGGTLTAVVSDTATGAGDGTVTWTYKVDNSATQHLAEGEKATESFTVTIDDGNGGTIDQVVTVTVTGTNDAPVVSDVSVGATEDGPAVASGFSGDDIDSDDDGTTLTYAITSTPAEGSAINNGDGTFSFDPGADFQDLAQGETRDVSFTYEAKDSHGVVSNTGTVTVTVTGTNDAPVVSDVSVGAVEDGPVATDNFAGDDVDSDDDGTTLTYAITSAPSEGSAINNGDGTFSFDPGADFQDLAQGETRDVSFTYEAKDSHGAVSNTGTVTVIVTGTNDAPVVSDVAVGAAEDGPVATDSFAGDDVDSDDDATSLIYTITSAPSEGSVINNGDGTFSFDPGTDFQDLAVGEIRQVSFTYEAKDSHSEVSNTGTVTVTVTGTNDAPVISLESGDSAAAELTDGSAALSVAGQLTATDADVSDEMKATVQTVSVGGTGGTNGMTPAQLLALFSISPLSPAIVDSALTTSGQITWSFDAAANVFDYLTAADTLTLTYSVKVEDGHGGSDTQDVTLTIHGVNESSAIIVTPPFTGTGDPNDFDTATATPTGTSSTNGNDVLVGTGANDGPINLGNGNDTFYAGGGNDTNVSGSNDNDKIYGQAGNDVINGNNDNDTLYGGSGDDNLDGGGGLDTLYGGSGVDTITGGTDADIIIGGYGADNLNGNGGSDTFRYLSVLDTGDVITGFESAGVAGGDVIDLSAIATTFGGTTATANGAWYATDGIDSTIYVDNDGNTSTAEFAITLKTVTSLVVGDFDLTP